jgi:thiol-disulfide isomerase/thioredoxin
MSRVPNRALWAGGGVIGLLLVLLSLNVVWMARNCDALRPLVPGRRAPPFSLKTPAGASVSLEAQKGKVVLVSFWASWCGPCMREMPFLGKLARSLRTEGLEVLAVNVEGEPEKVRQAITRIPPPLRVLVDEGEVAERYGVQTLPHLVVVDRAGEVAWVHVGSGRQDVLEKVIRRALKQSQQGPATRQ